MTNNNQYYIPKLPETSTVSYFDVNEWDKNLTKEQLAQQEHINSIYESEYQHRALTGPQYGPGGEGWKTLGGVLLTTLTIACPPAGLAVGAGVAAAGATVTIVGGIENDKEMMLDGLEVFEMGMGSAVGGYYGSGSHKARNCTFSAICPKK